MLELRVKTGRSHTSLFDLPVRLGRAAAVKEIGDAVEGLIVFLDELEGDPDLEDATDGEDEFALSPNAMEWASRETRGPGCEISDPDTGVDDDGEADTAEDSFHIPGHYLNLGRNGPGCSISDPGGEDDGF